MRIRFTKMQGAGNDFVVLDETKGLLGLDADDYRFLADRHFGVGGDQILSVRVAPTPDVDFEYVIHNADGGEVAPVPARAPAAPRGRSRSPPRSSSPRDAEPFPIEFVALRAAWGRVKSLL